MRAFSKKKRMYIFLIMTFMVLTTVFSLLLRSCISSEAFIRQTVISAFIVVIIEIYAISKLSKSFLNPSIIFLIVYYLFQNGQLLLLALGINFDTYYIGTLYSYADEVALFSSTSAMIAGFSGVVCTNTNNKSSRERTLSVDRYDPRDVSMAAFIGFAFTGVIAMTLIAMKLPYGLSGGYSAVRVFESTVPSILNFVEYLFVPFCILCLVFETNRTRRKVVIGVSVLWLVVTAMLGDRTTGIAGLFVAFFVEFQKSADNSRKEREGIFKICILGIVLLLLTNIISVTRIQGNFVWTSVFETATKFVSELGFSCFPLFTVMSVVPVRESFQCGMGYWASLVTGVIPASLDPTGTITVLFQQSDIIQTWHTKYFDQYDFGLGSSLNAEAYANFGWYGLISLLFLNIVIFSFLGMNNLKATNGRKGWKLYVTNVLLFLWFTLPRRHSYYVWKAISYGVVFIWGYLWLFASKNRMWRKVWRKVWGKLRNMIRKQGGVVENVEQNRNE